MVPSVVGPILRPVVSVGPRVMHLVSLYDDPPGLCAIILLIDGGIEIFSKAIRSDSSPATDVVAFDNNIMRAVRKLDGVAPRTHQSKSANDHVRGVDRDAVV